MVMIEDLQKIEIVVAEIKEVTTHPNADRLYVLKVDLGDEVRQVVAGIRAAYQPEQLIGRKVILVKNLQPAVIRGVESNGMLLAASDGQGLSLLGLDKEIALGSRVK